MVQATHVVLKLSVNIFKNEKKQVNFKNLTQNITIPTCNQYKTSKESILYFL